MSRDDWGYAHTVVLSNEGGMQPTREVLEVACNAILHYLERHT